MQPTLITTADGSHSLYVKDLDEHYHSIHGALQESKHVFIETGLKYLNSKNSSALNILEIGFGTGLNAILTLLEAEKLNISVNYTSLEAYPLSIELVNELNYSALISESEKLEEKPILEIFKKLHDSTWENENKISNHFTIQKLKNTLQEITFVKKFDLIYFDAFGPRVQPEMWTEELFSKIFAATNEQGCLVTYCAKGEVKRTLKKVGYMVETLPGPPRKREMVRGTKL
jgi:tRNA U34 5-methylaminomethyl-2-thiouridine-forming methyltransferase MnmC